MSRRRRTTAKFVLRLKVTGLSPADTWRLARAAEQILRERAPGGVEIKPLELSNTLGTPEFRDTMRRAGRTS